MQKFSVLVVEKRKAVRERLTTELHSSSRIERVAPSGTLDDVKNLRPSSRVNVVFIDPLEFDLEEASRAIFDVRKRAPRVVFVLLIAHSELEVSEAAFYEGDRRRFRHYFSLDKSRDHPWTASDLEKVLATCQADLDGRASNEPTTREPDVSRGPKPSVFVSHAGAHTRTRFEYVARLAAERNMDLVESSLLDPDPIDAVRALLDRCSGYVCLLTRDHELADGSWLPSLRVVEEKALAIAAGRLVIMLVEEGVGEWGSPRHPDQRIHFSPDKFHAAALKAMDKLHEHFGEQPTASWADPA